MRAPGLPRIGTFGVAQCDLRAQLVTEPGHGQTADTLIAAYHYDGRNYRIAKLLPNGENWDRTDYYYNDGAQPPSAVAWQVLEERTITAGSPTMGDGWDAADMAVHVQWLWDVRYIDAPVLRWRDADADPQTGLEEVLYYANDANMNVTALVDATPGSQTIGQVVERYVYDPYGRATVYNGDWSAELAWAASRKNEVTYCGYRFDAESDLHQVRWRYYLTSVGAWASRDMIARPQSRYDYARNNSLSLLDPMGLDDEAVTRRVNAVASQIQDAYWAAIAKARAIDREYGGDVSRVQVISDIYDTVYRGGAIAVGELPEYLVSRAMDIFDYYMTQDIPDDAPSISAEQVMVALQGRFGGIQREVEQRRQQAAEASRRARSSERTTISYRGPEIGRLGTYVVPIVLAYAQPNAPFDLSWPIELVPPGTFVGPVPVFATLTLGFDGNVTLCCAGDKLGLQFEAGVKGSLAGGVGGTLKVAPRAGQLPRQDHSRWRELLTASIVATGTPPACKAGVSGKATASLYVQLAYATGIQKVKTELLEWDFKHGVRPSFSLTYERSWEMGKIGIEIGVEGTIGGSYSFYLTTDGIVTADDK